MSEGLEAKIVAKLMGFFDEKRKALGLSHLNLADKAGLHRSTISLVLRGKSIPTIVVCLKIAKALEVDLSDYLKKATKSENR